MKRESEDDHRKIPVKKHGRPMFSYLKLKTKINSDNKIQ